MKTTNSVSCYYRSLIFSLLLLHGLLPAVQTQAQVALTPLAGFGGTDGWLTPGENGYAYLGTASLERGLAYGNNHLYLVSRNGGENIRILDKLTGADLGALPLGSGIISGGTYTVSTVGVAQDGVIYVANYAGPNNSSTPFKVYRWANELASPSLAYSNVNVSLGGLGYDLDVIGSGATTRIISGESTASGVSTRRGFVVLTTTGGVNYTGELARFITSPPNSGDFGPGITFTDATHAFGTQGRTGVDNPVRYVGFSTPSSPTLIGSPTLATVTERSVDYVVVNGWPLLATVNTSDSRVRVYDASNPTNLVLLVTSTATTAGTDYQAGAVAWGDKVNNGDGSFTVYLYALNLNRGIQAFTVTVGPCFLSAFNVTGGGSQCGGATVSLSGSQAGMAYLLHRNSVFTGTTLAGTGGALNFGTQPVTGGYSVVASNSTYGCTKLMVGTVNVTNNTPAVTSGPAPSGFTNYQGTPVTFAVTATGSGLNYRWRRDGTNLNNGGNIAGATSPVLTIFPVDPVDSVGPGHGYTCVVSGSCNPPAVSPEATLSVIPFVAVPEMVTAAWTNRYDGPGSSADTVTRMLMDNNGNVIVTGYADDNRSGNDMVTVKYSNAGVPMWTNRYNFPANRDDTSRGLAVDSAGNVLVVGSSYNGTNDDYYSAKYAAADGALLWEKRYNGPGNSNDVAQAVTVDSTGNVIVTGYSSNGTNDDYYTAKYAAVDGTLLWEKRYNYSGNSSDQATALAVDGNGDIAVTGVSSTDYYTAKHAAADGALLWEKRYNGPGNAGDTPTAIAVDTNGNVVVTGHSRSSSTHDDYYTVKYAASDGTLLWENRYSSVSIGVDQAKAVAIDPSGNVIVTGKSAGSSLNDYADYYTAKYAAADGALLWEKRYEGGSSFYSDVANSVAVDTAGNVIVTGYAYQVATGDAYYTAKYAAADGALLWEQRYTSPLKASYGQAVAVDGNGNVVVSGYSIISQYSESDFATVKYAAADGALIWEQRYNGPGGAQDVAQAVLVDKDGNVIVTGTSSFSNGGDGSDFYTAKYAPDGSLLWEKRYDGPAGKGDGATALALDASGNVVVTGSSMGTDGFSHYATLKYAAGDGSPIWEKRFEAGMSTPRAVAVDASGNVVVTGKSWTGFTDWDYYTAKYAAADGSLIWERSYNGPLGDKPDEPLALVLDAAGNAVVTGKSYNDYYTVKYAAADGAVLWAQRYSGGVPTGLAVDSSGNVIVSSVGYTAKYAAANGALVWMLRNGVDTGGFPNAVVVDGEGDVFVTGQSSALFNSYAGYYTAKYSGANGRLLWEVLYHGPANANDLPVALALDGNGDPVVTGYVSNGSYYEYYTAKYSGKNGALLWEKRYGGPAKGDNQPLTRYSLAIGPSGEVVVTGQSDGDYTSDVQYDYATIKYVSTAPSNIRPTLANPLPDTNGVYGTPFNFTFAANTFSEPDAGQALTYSASGLPSGITFAPATRTFSGTPTNIGTASVTVTATDNGTPALSTNDAFDIIIAKAPLTATADNKSRAYGQANSPLTFSYSGFVLGESDSVLDTVPIPGTTATPNSPVGPYPITLSGGADDHYTFSYLNGALTVTATPLTVTASDTNRTYGALNPGFTGGMNGLANADNITTTFSTTADTNSPPGAYPITPALVDPDNKRGNYAITTNAGILTVAAAALTVSVNDTNRIYGTPNPPFTGSLVGLVNADNITATFATTATITSPPGTYPVMPSLSDPDGKLGNYSVTTNNGTLTITSPPELSFTAGGAGGGLLTLSWPASAGNFLLEYTENLTPPISWQEVTSGTTENGGIKSYTVTNDPSVPGRLYRLRLP